MKSRFHVFKTIFCKISWDNLKLSFPLPPPFPQFNVGPIFSHTDQQHWVGGMGGLETTTVSCILQKIVWILKKKLKRTGPHQCIKFKKKMLYRELHYLHLPCGLLSGPAELISAIKTRFCPIFPIYSEFRFREIVALHQNKKRRQNLNIKLQREICAYKVWKCSF